MQNHSITLGMNIGTEGKVTNQMWLQFVETEICPVLQFATITDAIGIYKGTLENTKVISVTVDERSTGSDSIVKKLKEVGATYAQQFRQECIMYSKTESVDVAFV